MEKVRHITNTIRYLTDDYLKTSNGQLNILGKLLKILIIIIAIKIVISLTNKLIDKALRNKKGNNIFISNRRANTIGEVLKKIVKYVLYFIGIMMILEMFNVNTTSILATAGIGGLAIGFGAQSLVKDIITGFFILFEDQYAVGDYVKIESLEGTVEELGLRVTKLRDFSGDLHIIPNGRVQIVTNKTRGAMRALVDISVTYEENIDRVVKILEKVCADIKSSNDAILDGPTILGITDLGESSVSITIIAKTKPMEQWAVEREIRKKVREIFHRENIDIPYPRRVIFGGKDNDTKI
ncbi:mechanosensitive ion channel protein MscS [Tissierella sp. P1]|uniref:mechanosensitive ion channel family protein n=2 Tax=Tissierella TaxID=41273 RepID=UPI000BA176A2|nr:mechanosensitive ion channel family protein [Tissierella sp. P1]OZV13887.1 mechanosensitive ion channel protein MscS [Tissierella sp. P1]